MEYFAGMICALLVVLGPHTCRTQSILIGQAHRLSSEIDTMVKTANDDAATYVTELQQLFDNLNTSATTDFENLSDSANNIIASLQSEVSSLVDTVNDTDVSDCTDLANNVFAKVTEFLANLYTCVARELNQAEDEVELAIPYVNSQLDILASFQTLAQNCLARFYESEQTNSDAAQAFACVQPAHRSAQLFVLRLEFVIDIKLAEDLFDDFESRVATCISRGTDALVSLEFYAQATSGEISTCVSAALADSTS